MVRHLRFNRNTSMPAKSDEDAHNLRVQAQSLSNFADSVENIVKKSPQERSIYWNLDCAGKYKIPSTYVDEGQQKTFFLLKHEGVTLQILGSIETGFSSRLISAIADNPSVKNIALGSGGGSVAEAIQAGRFIRSRGLTTTLWNNCYSACPLVFLGGIERTIWAPYPKLGFHQIYTETGAIQFTSPVYTYVGKYIASMGASSKYVIALMQSASPNQMLELALDENLCRSGVTTWIQRFCNS
jgi:hypothetical protein